MTDYTSIMEKHKQTMDDYLVFSIDKFTFNIATDRSYTSEGMWVRLEKGLVRIGISDFLQQRNGDVAFVEIKPAGAQIVQGEEIAVIETIKVNISLTSPISGKVIEVNPVMDASPEIINQDPYHAGWMAIIDPTDWNSDLKRLLEPLTYYDKIKAEAESEMSTE